MRRPWGFLFMGAAAVAAGACGGTQPAAHEARAGASGPWIAEKVSTDLSSPAPTASVSSCARLRPGRGASRVGAMREGSSVALARSGEVTLAYAADEDDDAIHTFDVDSRAEIAVTPLEGSPSQILVLADGRVAATLRDRNRVVILEPFDRADSPLEARCSVAIAAEPVALAATPDDARLIVTSGWGRKLTALDAADLQSLFVVDLPREPRAVLVDGTRAFVTHVVGSKLSAVSLEGGDRAVHAVDLRVGVRSGSQGYALTKSVIAAGAEGLGAGPSRIFAPLASVHPGEAKLTTGYGSSGILGVVPLVSVVDSTAERTLTRSFGGGGSLHGKECVLPRAAAMGDRDALLVACLGTDELLELDARSLDPMRALRRRWRVPSGPTGIAVDVGRRAVVWSQFARELGIVDLSPPSTVAPGEAARGKTKRRREERAHAESAVVRVPAARRRDSRMTIEIARGRAVFHATDDPRISNDGRACASCHPDGREDALTWSTPDGPRQTIMLAGRVQGSDPYGWFGASRSLKIHITQTFDRLGGKGLGDEKDRADFDALIAYLGAMRPPSRAGEPVDPARAKTATRGREIFEGSRQGCATCHLGGATDKSAYDVASGRVIEARTKFDTPSLRFVGGTGPFFHDGRYGTLEELLEASDGTMGHTGQLSRPDLLALAVYLETL